VSKDDNVEQAVPFFGVSNLESSLRFYMDGLGFTMKYKWIDDGKLRWCWLEIGSAALMLQEFREEHRPKMRVGEGVTICFTCKDALKIYRDARARGLEARRPFVGNGFWVTELKDPDGLPHRFREPDQSFGRNGIRRMTVFDKGLITMAGCALLFVIPAIPLMLRKVPRNIVYGHRTRKTLSDDAI